MRAIGLGVTLAGLLFAGGLLAQVAAPQAPAAPAPPRRATGTVQAYGLNGGSYLGVGVAEVNADLVKSLKLKEERGALIVNVESDSPAAKAGLKKDDVVLEYNGQRVEGANQFSRMVRETPEGRRVRLLISRDGSTQTLTATVGVRKGFGEGFGDLGMSQAAVDKLQAEYERAQAAGDKARERMRTFSFTIPDMPQMWTGVNSRFLGVVAESLDPQLAEYFGVKDGVLVRSVNKDSAAAKAGLKAGDVITKVDATSVSQPTEITRALRALGDKKTVPLTLVRNHKEMTVSVTLEETRSVIEPMALPAFFATEGADTRL